MEESSYCLSNFTGPIDLLFFLIQKEELDIFDIPLQELTKQHLTQSHPLDDGADFLFFVSVLLLLKSKRLLHPKSPEIQELEISPELFEHLLLYERLREMALLLEKKEEKEKSCFFRDIPLSKEKSDTNFLPVDLKNLTSIFSQLIATKEKGKTLKIVEEKWQVSTKIEELKALLLQKKELSFQDVFSMELPKNELIVLFLALLELLRQRKVRFCKESSLIMWAPS